MAFEKEELGKELKVLLCNASVTYAAVFIQPFQFGLNDASVALCHGAHLQDEFVKHPTALFTGKCINPVKLSLIIINDKLLC